MIKKNKDNHLNKKQNLENKKTNNYYRGSSVEDKHNNSFFSKDLEKEYLDIKHLVKNSVEKINVLFNNEEFKQKTSKKIFQNNINKINVNKFNFNKQDSSSDLLRKEDEKKNNIYQENSEKTKRDSTKNNSLIGEGEEYKYNSNDLYEELKDLKNNNIKNNKSIAKFYKQKKINNNTESDNKALLNLESNKLYRNKDPNPKINNLNIANTMKIDKKQKNGIYISNYLKTARHQDLIHCKDRKIEPMKFVQKNINSNNNNKIKKIERNNNVLKQRYTNNSSLLYDKNIRRPNKDDKTLKSKFQNNSFKKDSSFYNKMKHNNSMNNIDINPTIKDINSSHLNLNIPIANEEKKNKNEKEDLILSINKHLYKGEKRDIFFDKVLSEFNPQNKKQVADDKNNNSGHNKINTNFTLPTLRKESPSKFINILNTKKKFEKISTQNLLKMVLMLNQYLINNNLIKDYSDPDNKRILDEFSLFLNNNIKFNDKKKKDSDDDINSGNKTERIMKKENNLINKINNDIKNNQSKLLKNKNKDKNGQLNDIFNNIINKYNLILKENN